MSVKRIYVEKRPEYAVEAKHLLWEIRHILLIRSVTGLRLLNRYDVEGVTDELYQRCLPVVFSEPQVDVTFDSLPQGGDAVAKTRMAAEELYKLKKRRRVKIPETV